MRTILKGVLLLGALVWSTMALANNGSAQYSQVDLLLFCPNNLPHVPLRARVYPMFIDQADFYLSRLGFEHIKAPNNSAEPLLLLPGLFQHLKAESNAIDNSSQAHLLAHLTWRQPIEAGKKKTVYFDTAALIPRPLSQVENGAPRMQVSGFIVFEKKKYVDVTLHWVVKIGDEVQPWHYVHLSRRLQHDQLNYLDDPVVGSLMLLTPLS